MLTAFSSVLYVNLKVYETYERPARPATIRNNALELSERGQTQ
jgi:hypothetical protein